MTDEELTQLYSAWKAVDSPPTFIEWVAATKKVKVREILVPVTKFIVETVTKRRGRG